MGWSFRSLIDSLSTGVVEVVMRPGRPSSTSSSNPVVVPADPAPPHCPRALLPRDLGITRNMSMAKNAQIKLVKIWIDLRSVFAGDVSFSVLVEMLDSAYKRKMVSALMK